ncbi:hypothetical protein PGT21_033020 [Puccinia graminis f. sp. tritici]|uniref:Uncharacterized protein n=1 Tax=Puccinia graminis f. sp. tritici TaxID=56615 RepID=A0A5B0LQX3_PUCGR|nr:hypothetical protein PGT21_033020 [Puccinia graminis f. sp. tritici]
MTSATLVEIFHHGHVNRASKLANTRKQGQEEGGTACLDTGGNVEPQRGLFNSIQWHDLPGIRIPASIQTSRFDKATDKPNTPSNPS